MDQGLSFCITCKKEIGYGLQCLKCLQHERKLKHTAYWQVVNKGRKSH